MSAQPAFLAGTNHMEWRRFLIFNAAGGIVWRITREGAGLKGVAGRHVSETEQASIPEGLFSHVIDNSGTRDELRSAVLVAAYTGETPPGPW